MAFPKRLLTQGEDLVLDLRPHWIALVWPVAQTILIGIATGLAIGYTPHSWPSWVRWLTFLAGFLLFLAFPVRAFVRWVTSHFVVTTRRVIRREGWIAKHSLEIPLERLNDVRFHQGVVERMIGAGDLVIESAGEHGQERFTHVRRPEYVQKTLYEMAEETQKRLSGAGIAAAAAAVAPPHEHVQHDTVRATEEMDPGYRTTEQVHHPQPPTTVEQLERLAELRERGVIDEQEFQEEKARILHEEE